MDDFPAFYSGISRLAMRWREQKLVRCVSNVIASSTALKLRWSYHREDVKLVHNGLDPKALPPPKVNDPTRTYRVLGYVGTIATWFDWEWVLALANARPKDVVRLIGPVFNSKPINLPNNVELLPACNHQTALAFMQDFDVGLIPFKRNRLTESVDPIKYYEYRALGLPVISTDFGEMALRVNVKGTFISTKIEDISRLVLKALQFAESQDPAIQFAESNSWENRFDDAGIF